MNIPLYIKKYIYQEHICLDNDSLTIQKLY